MILYTIVPDETVYAGIEQMQANYVEITLQGVQMQVEPVSMQEAKIVRLLSADPMHYLNAAFAPGQLVRFAGEAAGFGQGTNA